MRVVNFIIGAWLLVIAAALLDALIHLDFAAAGVLAFLLAICIKSPKKRREAKAREAAH